jgi:hypothetical protein
MTQVAIIASDGTISDVHEIAGGECPYYYAATRAIQDRKANLTRKYRIDEEPQDFSGDEVIATAAQIWCW